MNIAPIVLFFILAVITAVIGRLIISLGVIVEHPSFFTEIIFATVFSATMTAIAYKPFLKLFGRMV